MKLCWQKDNGSTKTILVLLCRAKRGSSIKQRAKQRQSPTLMRWMEPRCIFLTLWAWLCSRLLFRLFEHIWGWGRTFTTPPAPQNPKLKVNKGLSFVICTNKRGCTISGLCGFSLPWRQRGGLISKNTELTTPANVPFSFIYLFPLPLLGTQTAQWEPL